MIHAAVFVGDSLEELVNTAEYDDLTASEWESTREDLVRLGKSLEEGQALPAQGGAGPVFFFDDEKREDTDAATLPVPVRGKYILVKLLRSPAADGDTCEIMNFQPVGFVAEPEIDAAAYAAAERTVSGFSFAEWSMAADEALIAHATEVARTSSAMSPGALSTGELWEPSANKYPELAKFTFEAIAQRYKVLSLVADRVSRLLRLANLSAVDDAGSLGGLVSRARGLCFTSGKNPIWKAALNKTNFSRGEDDITMRLERLKAAAARDDPSLTPDQRLPSTLLGQLTPQLLAQEPHKWRTGQRAWNTKFVGEGSTDAGGPYREVFSNVCSEIVNGETTLFIPTPNNANNVGTHRECFTVNPSATSKFELQAFRAFGILIALCLRGNEELDLSLCSMFWKCLVSEPVTKDDLNAADCMVVQSLERMRRIEEEGVTADLFGDVVDEYWTTHLSDGSEVELCPGGAERLLTFEERHAWAAAVEATRRSECAVQIAAIREGLGSVVPANLMAMFTWREIEPMVCGSVTVDLAVLKKNTKYEGHARTAACVGHFWEALDSFTHEERRLFLRFVWGRSRLPANSDTLSQQFTIQTYYGPDDALPVAHTCFFSLELPNWQSFEIARARMLFAINNCSAIDTDFDAGEGSD